MAYNRAEAAERDRLRAILDVTDGEGETTDSRCPRCGWQARDFEDRDGFYEDADWPTYAIRDGEYQWWIAWGTEDGDWYAVRPPSEDDPTREVDPHRPIGPTPLDHVSLPWVAVALDNLDPEPTETEQSNG